MLVKSHNPVSNQVTCENKSHFNLEVIKATKPKKSPAISGLVRK
jgi:hypothetical protein